MKYALMAVLVGCASMPKTEASMLAARIRNAHDAGIWIECLPGMNMTPSGDEHADVCVDVEGLTWAFCAWNTCGRDEQCRIESDRKIMAGSCGGAGYPDCVP